MSENRVETVPPESFLEIFKDEPYEGSDLTRVRVPDKPIDIFDRPEVDDILLGPTEPSGYFLDKQLPLTSQVESQPLGPSVAGFVYCFTPPNACGHTGEVNIGIILQRQFRGRGYARQAIEMTLKWVFEEVHFHRVQAALMDTLGKDKALALFTQL
jgi:hypothetical protein